jgi:hypothetical protein
MPSDAMCCVQSIAHRHNPYILWVLTYSHLFGELDELIDELMTTLPQASSSSNSGAGSVGEAPAANRIEFKSDSLEEALIYYRLDSSLWLEVDNSVDILASYIHEKKLLPSIVNGAADKSSSSSDAASADQQEEDLPPRDLGATVDMCYEMYNTAVAIIKKELS